MNFLIKVYTYKLFIKRIDNLSLLSSQVCESLLRFLESNYTLYYLYLGWLAICAKYNNCLAAS